MKNQFGFILEHRSLFLTMNFWKTILILSIPMITQGQLLLNNNGEQLSDDLVFNPEFIKAKKIKSINGRFTFKRTGSVMRESNFWQVYEFDTLGRIIHSYETRKDDGTIDTIWNRYFYNDKGLLIYHSVGDKEFYKYITTVYDTDKRVVSVEEFRRKPDVYGIPIIVEEHIDRYSYEELGDKLIKTRMNKQGTPYAKITPFYNEKEQLIREEDRYITTSEGLIYQYEYDAKGNLLRRTTLTSKQGIKKEMYSFKYDSGGNIQEKKYFNEDKLKTEIQYIHSESTGLLSAVLYQESGSPTIVILRIKEYEYH
jgi:YD repeat-containing protein